MAILEGFRGKSFVEQIQILDRLESERNLEELPALFQLMEEPLGDGAVDQAVRDTLRAVLGQSEADTVRGLRSETESIRKLCLLVAGELHFPSAVPELLELSADEADPARLLEILSTMAKMGLPEFLPVFRRHLADPDPLVAAQCIEMIGFYRDEGSIGTLCAIIDDAEGPARYDQCDLPTEKAVAALAAIGGDRALSYLASKLHHRSPAVRRVIAHNLTLVGVGAVPYLERLLGTAPADDRILAANVLGSIGDRRGADALVAAIDQGAAEDPNVRFAIYEALGTTPSLKGLVCLTDGLGEESEMLLLAVVAGLDKQANPGVVAGVLDRLAAGGAQAERILRAVVAARATTLFREIYPHGQLGGRLVATVACSQEPETIALFRQEVLAADGPATADHAARLGGVEPRPAGRRLLAVDDSRSMLLFYKGVASGLGYDVTTAGSGREALDRIEAGETFHLILTDLNMPVMDGIQLAREVRSDLSHEAVPILMVTTESEASQVELAKRAGVTGFVQKPLSPEALAEHLRRHG